MVLHLLQQKTNKQTAKRLTKKGKTESSISAASKSKEDGTKHFSFFQCGHRESSKTIEPINQIKTEPFLQLGITFVLFSFLSNRRKEHDQFIQLKCNISFYVDGHTTPTSPSYLLARRNPI